MFFWTTKNLILKLTKIQFVFYPKIIEKAHSSYPTKTTKIIEHTKYPKPLFNCVHVIYNVCTVYILVQHNLDNPTKKRSNILEQLILVQQNFYRSLLGIQDL
jgi:hypothetical protein